NRMEEVDRALPKHAEIKKIYNGCEKIKEVMEPTERTYQNVHSALRLFRPAISPLVWCIRILPSGQSDGCGGRHRFRGLPKSQIRSRHSLGRIDSIVSVQDSAQNARRERD